MKTEKKNIVVDYTRQQTEKNIACQDYPCSELRTGNRLGNLGDHFESWDDYVKNGGEVFPALCMTQMTMRERLATRTPAEIKREEQIDAEIDGYVFAREEQTKRDFTEFRL